MPLLVNYWLLKGVADSVMTSNLSNKEQQKKIDGLTPDCCLHQSCYWWIPVVWQGELLLEAEWHGEDVCSPDSTHEEIETWKKLKLKKEKETKVYFV